MQLGHSGIQAGRQNVNCSDMKSQTSQDSESYRTTIELLLGKACLDEETLRQCPELTQTSQCSYSAHCRINCRGIRATLAVLHTSSVLFVKWRTTTSIP